MYICAYTYDPPLHLLFNCWILYYSTVEYCTIQLLNIVLFNRWILYYSTVKYCTIQLLNIVLFNRWILYYSTVEYCVYINASYVDTSHSCWTQAANLHMHIHTYIHTYTHIHKCNTNIQIRTYTHAHTHTQVTLSIRSDKCIRLLPHVCIYIYIYAHTHMHTQVTSPTRSDKVLLPYIHTYIYIYIYTHTYMHTYTGDIPYSPRQGLQLLRSCQNMVWCSKQMSGPGSWTRDLHLNPWNQCNIRWYDTIAVCSWNFRTPSLDRSEWHCFWGRVGVGWWQYVVL